MIKIIVKSAWDFAVGSYAAAFGAAIYEVGSYVYHSYVYSKEKIKENEENNFPIPL